MGFGKFLKQKRIEKNLSLRQMSYKTGFSHSYISDIEKEVSSKKETIEKIIEVLELTSEERAFVLQELEYLKTPKNVMDELNTLKKKSCEGEVKFIDVKVVELPVYGKASAGKGHINLETVLKYKKVIDDEFSPDSFLVEVSGDSMATLINDEDIVIVDPQLNDYVAGKIYVITYNDETYIKQVQCPKKNMIVLKSLNSSYEDKYIIDEEIKELKVEGRVVKVITEKKL